MRSDDKNLQLGAPVVPFYPFSFWVPLLKPNSRTKGTLIIKGPLGNLDKREVMAMVVQGSHNIQAIGRSPDANHNATSRLRSGSVKVPT